LPTAPDFNAHVGGLLRDLALIQTSKQKTFGYKRAAAVVLSLDRQIDQWMAAEGPDIKLAGLGPASMRVVAEVIAHGQSPHVEKAVDESGRRVEVDRRRAFRIHFLSRAEVVRVLATNTSTGPSPDDYRGDFQMHTTWSDGGASIAEMASGCIGRGYHYAAITDHSYGLAIAGGLTMASIADQQREIDMVNEACDGRFRVFKGIEANISADGTLDLSDAEVREVELVLAAPHSKLRIEDDQTGRLVRAVRTPGVHVLAHPRGRMADTRAGIRADWPRIFEEAVRCNVAIELDGDPSRQDLDHELAAVALELGCLFALDSDAHSVAQLRYADTAIAHARLAAIPSSRIVNCWPLPKLVDWLSSHRRPRRRRRAAARP
jgi:histidinol phosphatase-like PHP family hydrolase